MITDSFDLDSPAKINPDLNGYRVKCDGCVVTFSFIIKEYILDNFPYIEIGKLKSCTGWVPVYLIDYKGKLIAFFKTYVGAPITVGLLEDVTELIDTDDFVVFGAAGTLDKKIEQGSIMVPTEAYRDEGTSYHYAKPADYIKIKNHNIVSDFLSEIGIRYFEGKTWTTDAFFRETENNIKRRQDDGCISVEMECSAVQAWADFRNLNLYYFLVSGDLLDAPRWDARHQNSELSANHHCNNVTFAFDLIAEKGGLR